MSDITHIEWAGFAGIGRLGEWFRRRRVREEAREGVGRRRDRGGSAGIEVRIEV